MININRSQKPKNDLKYTDEEVREQVEKDFFKMCYLCEEVTRHFEIDHFYPQKYYPDHVNDWENLFYICEKCNKIRPKKINTENENEILDNTKDDVESLIILRFDEVNNEIEISTDNKDPKLLPKIQNTINLLHKIYNGIDTKSKSYKQLRKEIKEEIEKFYKSLEKYEQAIDNLKIYYEEDIAKRLIKKSMQKDSSFVSFKRRIILDNPQWLNFKIYFD